jgi:ribosome assembly protein 1
LLPFGNYTKLYSQGHSANSRDSPAIQKILDSLGIKLLQKEILSKDSRGLLKNIMTKWLPLSKAALASIAIHLPSPSEAQAAKIDNVLQLKSSSPEGDLILQSMRECNGSSNAPLTIFVSKMFGIHPKDLPNTNFIEDQDSQILIGFARIYSGIVRKNQQLYVLGPKYSPKEPSLHSCQVTIGRLFIMMGKDLQEVDHVSAGNVFAIEGLQGSVLKNATLADSLMCPSLGSLNTDAPPIVHVALEPVDPRMLFSYRRPQCSGQGTRFAKPCRPCPDGPPARKRRKYHLLRRRVTFGSICH